MNKLLCLIVISFTVVTPSFGQAQYDLNFLNQGKPAFPRIWDPYRPAPLPPLDSHNGPTVSNYIREGKLALSLSQFLQLVVENNLALEAARYNYLISQVDVLRTKAGQAARGVPSVPVPAALFAGAIGAGVGNVVNVTSQGTGGSAISGNAKSISLNPRGIFDPTLSINMSWDHVATPLNTTKVAGVPTVVTPSAVLQTRFQQQLPFGTGYSFSFNMQRLSTTQAHILYNPAWTSFFSISVYHPLLNGAGRAFTKRFVDLAENDRRMAYEAFHIDLSGALSNAANAYWDFVAVRESEKVAQQELALAETIYNSTRQRIELGTLAASDLIAAESQLAATRRDFILAQTNTQLQEIVLKSLVTKALGPDVDAIRLEPLDSLEATRDTPVPAVDDALRTAMRRSLIRQAEIGLENQNIAQTFTRSNLRPILSVFGEVNSFALAPGLGGMFRQMSRYAYPEFTVGLTLSFSVKNRAAQADDIRARLEVKQAQTAFEQTKANVVVQVHSALTNSVQTRAQVEAARRAVVASQQTAAAEQLKWNSGFSTLENVYQTQLDLVRAQTAEIQSRIDHAKAVIAQQVAVGTFLEDHNIVYDSALQGRLWRGTPTR